MNSRFVGKLAINNIKQNRKFYIPYILASIGIIMMFYIMSFLAYNTGIKEMPGATSLSAIMMLGLIVIGTFALIFIFYINSFLIKRRKKEIGLYNILGMEKKHISKIMFVENFIVSSISIIAGLVCGITFSRLVFLILCKTMGGTTPIGFEISLKGIAFSVIVFGIIFLLTLIKNQMSITLSKPIELLQGGNVGEREPKTKGIMAVLGILSLGTGYYIAITTDNPLSAIMLFFVAVLLVILGTYLIFISGSIAILKALRKNKKFYYTPRHFTSVSGMIYRMKQNAVGLANICILSTMVLVMISTTACLQVGMKDVINTICPKDITVNYTLNQGGKDAVLDADDSIRKACEKEDVNIKSEEKYWGVSLLTDRDENNFSTPEGSNSGNTQVNMISLEQYSQLTGKYPTLAKNQVLVYGNDIPPQFNIGDYTFTVKKEVDKFLPVQDSNEGLYDIYYLVVYDDEILKDISSSFRTDFGNDSSEKDCYYKLVFNTDASKEKIQKMIGSIKNVDNSYVSVNIRTETEDQYFGFTGGFLFLGVFLGIVFTFAAALIIYYKQISEGYYDKDKFEIMQKVGMSKDEVKKTIRTQVLMVFFAPLAMAAIHIMAAFNLIKELLKLFGLTNVGLFASCTAITFLLFAIIYAVVYGVTAREYYKIVG